MEVLVILGILFIALIVIIPLIEKSNMRVSDETSSKISRFIWPLIMVMLIVQLFMLAFASSANATSLWQVSKANDVMYIGGTVHILPEDDNKIPKPFYTALAKVDEVYFETDQAFLESPQFQQMAMQKLMYSDGRTFTDELSSETVEKVKTHLTQRGMPVEPFLPMKPSLLGLTLTIIELEILGLTAPGVDKVFFEKAVSAGKTINWFESPEQQLEFMQAMAEGQEDEFVSYSLAETVIAQAILKDMIDAWRVGDMTKMAELGIEELAAEYPKIYDILLVQRNKRWLENINDMFIDDDVELVLVGALHLAGPESVLAMLAEQGYTITQLK